MPAGEFKQADVVERFVLRSTRLTEPLLPIPHAPVLPVVLPTKARWRTVSTPTPTGRCCTATLATAPGLEETVKVSATLAPVAATTAVVSAGSMATPVGETSVATLATTVAPTKSTIDAVLLPELATTAN